jgi:hypothetical protein
MIAETLGGIESARNAIRRDRKFIRYSGGMTSLLEHQNGCGGVGIRVLCSHDRNINSRERIVMKCGTGDC